MGDAIAEAALTSIYLPVAAKLVAADMNCTEIQLADLIQECEWCCSRLFPTRDERKDDAWLRLQLRKGIIKAIEEQTRRKFLMDDWSGNKVEKLNRQNDLTDDDGEKRFTIDESAAASI